MFQHMLCVLAIFVVGGCSGFTFKDSGVPFGIPARETAVKKPPIATDRLPVARTDTPPRQDEVIVPLVGRPFATARKEIPPAVRNRAAVISPIPNKLRAERELAAQKRLDDAAASARQSEERARIASEEAIRLGQDNRDLKARVDELQQQKNQQLKEQLASSTQPSFWKDFGQGVILPILAAVIFIILLSMVSRWRRSTPAPSVLLARNGFVRRDVQVEDINEEERDKRRERMNYVIPRFEEKFDRIYRTERLPRPILYTTVVQPETRRLYILAERRPGRTHPTINDPTLVDRIDQILEELRGEGFPFKSANEPREYGDGVVFELEYIPEQGDREETR